MSALPAVAFADSVSEGINLRGHLKVPESHTCGPFVGDDCLVCLLQRRLLDGEVVSLHLRVRDVDY